MWARKYTPVEFKTPTFVTEGLRTSGCLTILPTGFPSWHGIGTVVFDGLGTVQR